MTAPRDAYVTVWVYDDPASGIEVDTSPGFGTAVEMPPDLLGRFRAAEALFGEVAAEVSDLLDAAKHQKAEETS